MICDAEPRKILNRVCLDQSQSDELVVALTGLAILPQAQKVTRVRVAALTAARRLLCHSGNPDHFDLRTSKIGHWCLVSLRSSLRDLRIAAGLVFPSRTRHKTYNQSRRTLTVFLHDDINLGTLRHNCIEALDLLRNQSEKSDLNIQETCILALGQIASYVRVGGNVTRVPLTNV